MININGVWQSVDYSQTSEEYPGGEIVENVNEYFGFFDNYIVGYYISKKSDYFEPTNKVWAETAGTYNVIDKNLIAAKLESELMNETYNYRIQIISEEELEIYDERYPEDKRRFRKLHEI